MASELVRLVRSKDRGAVAELKFHVAARERGLHPVKFEEGSPIDFIVYNEDADSFFKVQVKSCLEKEPRGTFRFKTSIGTKGVKKYRRKDVDVFALYVYATDEWFFMPSEKVIEYTILRFDETSELYLYKNNWEIFSNAH